MLNLNSSRERIAAALTKARYESGLTQDAVSKLTGMSPATIKRFESGKFWINLKQLVIYCDAIGVDIIRLN